MVILTELLTLLGKKKGRVHFLSRHYWQSVQVFITYIVFLSSGSYLKLFWYRLYNIYKITRSIKRTFLLYKRNLLKILLRWAFFIILFHNLPLVFPQSHKPLKCGRICTRRIFILSSIISKFIELKTFNKSECKNVMI